MYLTNTFFFISDDPEERENLIEKKESIAKELLSRLFSYLPEYVHRLPNKEDFRGHPSNFNGILTPGWCNK